MIHSGDVASLRTLSRKPRDDEIDVYGITDTGRPAPKIRITS